MSNDYGSHVMRYMVVAVLSVGGVVALAPLQSSMRSVVTGEDVERSQETQIDLSASITGNPSGADHEPAVPSEPALPYQNIDLPAYMDPQDGRPPRADYPPLVQAATPPRFIPREYAVNWSPGRLIADSGTYEAAYVRFDEQRHTYTAENPLFNEYPVHKWLIHRDKGILHSTHKTKNTKFWSANYLTIWSDRGVVDNMPTPDSVHWTRNDETEKFLEWGPYSALVYEKNSSGQRTSKLYADKELYAEVLWQDAGGPLGDQHIPDRIRRYQDGELFEEIDVTLEWESRDNFLERLVGKDWWSATLSVRVKRGDDVQERVLFEGEPMWKSTRHEHSRQPEFRFLNGDESLQMRADEFGNIQTFAFRSEPLAPFTTFNAWGDLIVDVPTTTTSSLEIREHKDLLSNETTLVSRSGGHASMQWLDRFDPKSGERITDYSSRDTGPILRWVTRGDDLEVFDGQGHLIRVLAPAPYGPYLNTDP